jgi:hypothetical protein
MAHPIIMMWTVPRSVSTSFERMVIERGDHTVYDEPFSKRYYYGDDRRSDRYTEQLPGSSAAELLAEIERAAEERPVFVKDMAYHAAGLLDEDLLGRFRNCFLVRDPAATIRSLADRWPDFTDEEAGWDSLDETADVVERLGQPFVVVDAADLCRDPRAVVASWCAAMDLPFVEDALTWEPGMRPEWELWADWHASTARSPGFHPLREPPPPPGDDQPRLQGLYARALPVYERLLAHRTTPA